MATSSSARSESGVGEIMKITSVHLDDEAAKIAEHIPNLSSFVRESLKRWANQNRVTAESQHLHWRETVGICWPFSSRGLCATCWPDGPPPYASWILFTRTDAEWEGHDIEWIKAQAREHSEGAEINLREMHFNRFERTGHDQQPQRGIFARLRSILGR